MISDNYHSSGWQGIPAITCTLNFNEALGKLIIFDIEKLRSSNLTFCSSVIDTASYYSG